MTSEMHDKLTIAVWLAAEEAANGKAASSGVLGLVEKYYGSSLTPDELAAAEELFHFFYQAATGANKKKS